MRLVKFGIAGLTAMAALMASSHAVAATATGNVNVTASVPSNCIVRGGTLAFGNYDPLATTDLDGTGTLTVACTRGTSYTIALSTSDSGAVVGARRMVHSTDATSLLTYEVYNDTNRTTVWNATNQVSFTSTSRADQAFTMYGRITAGQDPLTGSYADTLVATVTF